MVGVYYSWEYIINMSGNIKIGIIYIASKNGDYIKNHLFYDQINYDQTAAAQGKFIWYSSFKIELMSPTHLVKLY